MVSFPDTPEGNANAERLFKEFAARWGVTDPDDLAVIRNRQKEGEYVCTWPYVNGVPEGTAKRYDKSGRLISKTTYRNGDLVLYQKCTKQNNCTN